MTAIEWTDETLNVVTGCDIVSPGCGHCYAKDLAPRLRAMGNPKYQDVNDGEPPTSGPAFGVTLHPHELEKPFHWRKPRKVFVCSMGDLFHERVPRGFIDRVFAVMALTPHITYQVLTKRPDRMRDHLSALPRPGHGLPGIGDAPAARIGAQVQRIVSERGIENTYKHWPLPNVWLGTSIELRTYAGRADDLRATPAAVRFISAEPLLGPLVAPADPPGWLDLAEIDWLIVGGESGPEARRIGPQWVRDLRDWCLYPTHGGQGPAFFFKQWGGRTPKAGGRELDGRTWDEFPEPRAREAVAA